MSTNLGLEKFLAGRDRENPLEVIGLSPAILELGLADDDLYELCRKMAKTLLVNYHPDRREVATPAVEETQRRFAKAFELLKDRSVFERALKEFRQQRSEDRSEFNRLSRELTRMHELNQELQGKVEPLEQSLREAEARNLRLRDRLTQVLRLAGYPDPTKSAAGVPRMIQVSACHSLTVLYFSFTPAEYLPDKNKVETLRQRYEKLHALNRRERVPQKSWERLKVKLRLARAHVISPQLLIDEALQSRELFPAISWTEQIAFSRLGFKRFSVGRHKVESELPAPSSQPTLPVLSQHYRSALQAVRRLVGTKGRAVTEMEVAARQYEVKDGVISANSGVYRILGTVPLDCIKADDLLVDVTPIFTVEGLVDKLEPRIIPGGLLITVAVDRKGKRAPKTPAHYARDIVLDFQ